MTRPRQVPKELVDQALSNLDRTSVIIVGAAEYRDLPNLHGPTFDLEMMFDLLVEDDEISLYKPNQVIELGNPTSARFREAILDYAQSRSARGDILLFYFTGHGCVLDANTFGFCLTDTRLGVEGRGVLPLSVVPFSEVLQTLATYDVHPIFILDACFSSMTAPQGDSLVANNLQNAMRAAKSETFALIASSGSRSTSIDTSIGGVFTQSLYLIIKNGLSGGSGKLQPFITLKELASPLQELLAQEGHPLSRCYVGDDLPLVPIARNSTYTPQTERFSPYMKQIVEYLWNNGSPREVQISDLITTVGRGAYGNHTKLGYQPWNLLEYGKVKKIRKLTSQGMKFAQGNHKIPRVIIRDLNTWEWQAAPDTDYIRITDV